MKTYFLLICCLLNTTVVHAQQTCKLSSIPASTPDSQLVDNGNGTVTDSKTGLMWKKCPEGLSGDNCEIGSAGSFTWQDTLQQPITVNNSGGFAGYADWRLPNINELFSIVEEQCSDPAINLTNFPNTPNSLFWSGSPGVGYLSNCAWSIRFDFGYPNYSNRDHSYAVRLVRGGH